MKARRAFTLIELLNDGIGDASIDNGDHHRTIGRVAGTERSSAALGGPWQFGLGRGPADVGGGARRYERIFGGWHPGYATSCSPTGASMGYR